MASRPVVILCQFLFPEMNATGELLTSLGTGLAGRGMTVTAYAAQPSYFGVTRVVPRLEHDGMVIRRLWSTHLGRRSKIARIIDGATFMLRMIAEIPRFPRGAVVLAVTNPPLLPFVGALRRLLYGSPLVIIVHDVYPEIAVRLGALKKNGLGHRSLRLLDRFSLSQADTIVVLGRDMASELAAKFKPGGHCPIVTIPNWADPTRISPMPKASSPIAQREGLLGKFVVQYSGNLGMSQGLETVLSAAEKLLDADVLFTLVGDGTHASALKETVEREQLTNVRFLARVEPTRLADSLAACDAALVSLSASAVGLSVPSKFYGILASGRPVIAVMPAHGEVARSVVEHGCGVVVPPNDPAALVTAIRRLSADHDLVRRMGVNARVAFERLYTRERALAAYERVLATLRKKPVNSDTAEAL
ncbi:MAG TPA: glycosyltransferase family 4 protein [Tepidisphaeraceae bacterium]